MVIDPAVVGLPGHGGVGDGDDGSGQAGPHRIGGQQRRTQGRLVEQPTSFIKAQKDFRSAVDAGHRVGGGQIGGTGIGRRIHPVDLHRGIVRPQTAVGDETVQGPGTDRVAELCFLGQSG